MKAMLLTAGLGTRLRPITDHFAKPTVPFLNLPLLYYPLALMVEAGAQSLIFNTHYKPEQIEHTLHALHGQKIDITFSHEPRQPLGSGGGIWQAQSFLRGGDFLVGNGDEVILPRESAIMSRLLLAHRTHRSLATILVMEHPLVGSQFGGVWSDDQGDVHGFGLDGKKFPGCKGYHYIGLMQLNDHVFAYLPEGESNIFYDALTMAIAKGEKVRVVIGDFTWFETGNPKDFLHASRRALSLLARSEMQMDASFLRHIFSKFAQCAPHIEHLPYNGAALIGNGCRIDSDAQLRGLVVLGENVSIPKNAIVENSVVFANSKIESGTHVLNDIVLPKFV